MSLKSNLKSWNVESSLLHSLYRRYSEVRSIEGKNKLCYCKKIDIHCPLSEALGNKLLQKHPSHFLRNSPGFFIEVWWFSKTNPSASKHLYTKFSIKAMLGLVSNLPSIFSQTLNNPVGLNYTKPEEPELYLERTSLLTFSRAFPTFLTFFIKGL